MCVVVFANSDGIFSDDDGVDVVMNSDGSRGASNENWSGGFTILFAMFSAVVPLVLWMDI